MRIGVMHVIDTLVAAGAERVAVNIVNALPRDAYTPYLCTTRADGPLDSDVAPDVQRLRLERKSRFDVGAVRRLVRFIRENDIRLLHAHSSALFIARAAAAFEPHPAIIWHAHYGGYASAGRSSLAYRLGTRGIEGVIAVNSDLAVWCAKKLGVNRDAVCYIANPCAEPLVDSVPELPGIRGSRIICVANFRPEKDHFSLLHAMAQVGRAVPKAHLMLAGKCNDAGYLEKVRNQIPALGLDKHVTILGERHDIPAILRNCDIGVLSSVSEGLPMSLLEYGMAGLPVVATEVGQCPEVLDYGWAGILVPPHSTDRLADGIISLLERPQSRQEMGERLRTVVRAKFSAQRIIGQICNVYETVLRQRSDDGTRLKQDVKGAIA